MFQFHRLAAFPLVILATDWLSVITVADTGNILLQMGVQKVGETDSPEHSAPTHHQSADMVRPAAKTPPAKKEEDEIDPAVLEKLLEGFMTKFDGMQNKMNDMAEKVGKKMADMEDKVGKQMANIDKREGSKKKIAKRKKRVANRFEKQTAKVDKLKEGERGAMS